jgi:hypothetical protein
MQTLAGLNLARPSISALRLEAKGRVKRWGATGLLVRCHDTLWLITAWHVLSGRRSDTGRSEGEEQNRSTDLDNRLGGSLAEQRAHAASEGVYRCHSNG